MKHLILINALLFIALPAHAAKMAVNSNIRYSQEQTSNPELLSLDIYHIPQTKPAPVLIMIHGGGWKNGDKANKDVGENKAAYFTKNGYIYVSINYRLLPEVNYVEQAGDVGKALAWVVKNISYYGGDSNKIFVMGHSAGAHLAALTTTDPHYIKQAGAKLSDIRGVILLDSAGYNILAMAEHKSNYKDVFGTDPAVLKNASPLYHVARGKNIPPFLVFHTDRTITRLSSEQFVEALKQAGIQAKVVEAADRTHSSLNRKIGTPQDPYGPGILKFMKRYE